MFIKYQDFLLLLNFWEITFLPITSNIFHLLAVEIIVSFSIFLLIIYFLYNSSKNFKTNFFLNWYSFKFCLFVLALMVFFTYFLDNSPVFILNNCFIKNINTINNQMYFLILSFYFIFSLRNYSLLKNIKLIDFIYLFLFLVFFNLVFIETCDLLTFYLCLEGLSLTLVILIALNSQSYLTIESSLKYFCLNSLASGFFLFSFSLLFFLSGSLNFITIKAILMYEIAFLKPSLFFIIIQIALVFLIFAFFFKLSVFPCYFWSPDVFRKFKTLIFYIVVLNIILSLFFMKDHIYH